jgi:hypothetical protein
MAIPSYLSNVLDKNINTFGDWFERTNSLSSDMGSKVLTAETTVSGGTATGNTSLVGIFSASEVAVGTSLRGGTLTTPAALSIVSATTFTANTNFSALETISNHTSNSITANTLVLSTDIISATSQTFSLTSDATTLTTTNDLTLSAGNVVLNGNIKSTDGILNLTSTAVLEVSSPSDAMRITQIGTGNALVVEDNSSPDSTPFIITNIGRVGIGTASPSSKLEVVGDVIVSGSLSLGGTIITSTATELNKLDGLTATTGELNKLSGILSSTAELNILDGVTATATEINKLDGVTATTGELNRMTGLTATTTELNTLDGILSSTTELNKLSGCVASTAELNKLSGILVSTTELNYLNGVNSSIQTQINLRAPKISPFLTGTPNADTPPQRVNSTRIATTAFVNEAVIGMGSQLWQDMSASRSFGVIYHNTSQRTIMVSVSGPDNTQFEVSADLVTWVVLGLTDTDQDNGSQPGGFIIPDLHYYRQTGSGTPTLWVELR